MAGLHQKFGGRKAGQFLALIKKHPVMLAEDKVAAVAEGAGGNDHGGKGPDGAQAGVADPANRLAAVVAGQDGIAGMQRLDRALRAVGKGDHRAPGKGQAQKVGQQQVGGRRFDRDKGVIDLRADGRQGQGKARVLVQTQDQEADPFAIGGHQVIARLEPDLLPLASDGRACGDMLIGTAGLADNKAQRNGVTVKLVDVARINRVRPGQIVALIGAAGHEDVGRPEDLAGMSWLGPGLGCGRFQVGHGRNDPLNAGCGKMKNSG